MVSKTGKKLARERPSNLDKVNTMKRIISALAVALTTFLPAFAQTDKPNVSVPAEFGFGFWRTSAGRIQ